MKKKTINQQIVKALAVGISASMALQPMAVFAEEVDGTPIVPAMPIAEPTPVQESGSIPAAELTEAEPQDIDGGIGDEAQEAADVVSNDVESNEETGEVRGDLDTTDDDTQVLTDDILINQNKPWEGPPTSVVPFEAGPSYLGTDAATNVAVDAAVIATHDHAEDAKADVESAKKDVIIAEISEAQEEQTAQDASEAVNEMQTVAENANQQVDTAITQANNYVQGIKDATTAATAQQNYDDLVALAGETQQAVQKASDKLDELNDKYGKAIGALEFAQNRFNEAINNKDDGAIAEVAAASAEMKRANEEIQKLKADISIAENNIKRVNATALEIVALQEEVASATDLIEKSEKQDQLFMTVIEKHYAKEIAGAFAADIKVSKSDSGYFTLSYKNGFDSKKVKYSYEVKENGDISFKKLNDEQVAALDYAANYEKEHKISLTDDMRTVYKYQSGRQTKLITKYELENREDVALVDGTYYFIKGNGEIKERIAVVGENFKPGFDDIKQGETKEFVTDVDEDTVEVSYEIKNGHLLKHTTATVTVAEYERGATEEAEYKKEGYSKKEKKDTKKELDKDETIVISKIVDTNKTYLVVSGNYTPTFIINLDDKDLYKRGYSSADVKNQIYWDIADDLPCGFKGYYDESDVEAKYEKDVLGKLFTENYAISGQVVISLDATSRKIYSDEFVYTDDDSFAAAIANLKEKMAENLGSDGFSMGNIVINSYKKQLVWEDGCFFDYPAIKDVVKAQTITPTESYDLNECSVKANTYDKYSYYLDYIKKLNEKTQENQVISTVEYKKAVAAIEILQSAGKSNDLIDKNYQAQLDYAKYLIDKYQRYAQEAEQVSKDIKKTQEDLGTLDEAIKRLNDTQKAGVLLEALLNGVSIADYFGISELPEDEKADILGDKTEEDLEDFSVEELINLLDKLKEKAEDKLEGAKIKLAQFDDILDEADEALRNTLNNLPNNNPGPSGDDDTDEEPDAPTYDGPSEAPVSVPIYVQATAAAPAPAAVLGETRPVRRNTVAKAAEEAPAEETKPAPEVKAEQKAPEKKEDKKVETTIAEEETAKAASPVVEDKPFAWGWLLLILAALAGVSVEEYVRRKNAKAKANSGNDKAN